MLAARRPLPLVLNRELFGVWFFKINLTVGQFWAPKGGPGADNMHNKIQDLPTRRGSPDSPRICDDANFRKDLTFTRIPRMTVVAEDQLPQINWYYITN